jgi:hypothetical protein
LGQPKVLLKKNLEENSDMATIDGRGVMSSKL